MNGARLLTLLPTLHTRRPLTVIGAAVIDIIADAWTLPRRGGDIELQQQNVNVGGCALNIAVALKRLGIDASNALPLGQGVWAERIRRRLAKEGLSSVIDAVEGDNGWCLALVEPDGERTFMSFSGVENQWNADWLSQLRTPRGSLVYLSGYQLASSCGEPLIQWLETVDDVTPFIDFGPRIGDITDDTMARIMACRPIVSLNRQEGIIAAERAGLATDTRTFGEAWVNRFSAPLVVRHDKDGAWYFSAQSSGVVPAFPATVVDTIGAGDSHAGGVLAGLASGWSLADAVLLGNAVASWVVGHRGGDCAPTREALLLAHKNV
ncbi:sugar kinase [Salmonella enterica]|nr:sugar kinase [Salmonella enterica]EMD4776343.1 sugar kinase [Salmonella enterica]EMD4795440.1 sugar kinase [Salmonella enterica]EMD4835542.1 sugar kinase [Salmonella enterica]